MEFQPTAEVEREIIQPVAHYEPHVLPIEEMGKIFPYGDYEYIPKGEGVVEKVWCKHFDGKINKYALKIPIAGLTYLFKFSGEENKNPYTLTFKTIEYQFAKANLDDESSVILFERLADFIETVYIDAGEKIKLIDISPSDASYSVREIEDCISEILKKSKAYSEAELRENYKGYKIFDLYQSLFDKQYTEVHYNQVSRAGARARYFKRLQKYFKNWEIDEVYGNSIHFYISRKEDLGSVDAAVQGK